LVHHVSQVPAKLRIVSSVTHPGATPSVRHHGAVVLAADRVAFQMGGSGSCPPAAQQVRVSGHDLVVPITDGSGHRGCTADLRGYTVVVRLNQPVLAGTAITSLRTGYNVRRHPLRIGLGRGLVCPVRSCVSRHRADIDGDGKADQITIRVPLSSQRATYFRGRYTVIARLATGRRLATRVRATGWLDFSPRHGGLWRGAYQLDGRGGVEVLVGNVQGANYVGYHALTVSHGKLGPLPAPAQAWFNKGGTYSGTIAYTCTPHGVELRSAILTNRHGSRRIRVLVSRYHQTAHAWQRVGHHRYRVGAWRNAGDLKPWDHCPTS
jgi:hypothetical protein